MLCPVAWHVFQPIELTIKQPNLAAVLALFGMRDINELNQVCSGA